MTASNVVTRFHIAMARYMRAVFHLSIVFSLIILAFAVYGLAADAPWHYPPWSIWLLLLVAAFCYAGAKLSGFVSRTLRERLQAQAAREP
ncbi:hypothetical protein DX914_02545 [Lysobacter silvisoli]|uniref:Uncharacterized protein n=1 Tax=Lysobacter silvisoli TaxID=2293254 RepID=A0A371K2D9_9GAMM|nr:hypothetical protein DX914_02545 [Lysobacter silvisoli]